MFPSLFFTEMGPAMFRSTTCPRLVTMLAPSMLGATILLSVIGDVNDFASEGKLAAYFGIVPRVSNLNETERSGQITKRGTKLGRTTLVQCALIAKRYSPYLARFYERIKFRCSTGKAIIALAKQLLGSVYNTRKEDWGFVGFPNFELATE